MSLKIKEEFEGRRKEGAASSLKARFRHKAKLQKVKNSPKLARHKCRRLTLDHHPPPHTCLLLCLLTRNLLQFPLITNTRILLLRPQSLLLHRSTSMYYINSTRPPRQACLFQQDIIASAHLAKRLTTRIQRLSSTHSHPPILPPTAVLK